MFVQCRPFQVHLDPVVVRVTIVLRSPIAAHEEMPGVQFALKSESVHEELLRLRNLRGSLPAGLLVGVRSPEPTASTLSREEAAHTKAQGKTEATIVVAKEGTYDLLDPFQPMFERIVVDIELPG